MSEQSGKGAPANEAAEDEDFKETVLRADDTGMLSNERLITDGEIERGEHPNRREKQPKE